MTGQGTLVTIDGRPALRFERRYRHPVERVWRAVSDPSEMGAWFPSAVIGEREVGAELVFDDADQRAADRDAGEPTRADGPLFRGTVVAYDPPKVFSFTWGGELLRMELTPEGEETVLLFTHLLSDRSVAARNGSGWHMCLAQLDALLGAPASDPSPDNDGWMAVYDHYLDRMGPPIGVPAVNGSVTWERATHVAPEDVRAATSDEATIEDWGGKEHTGDPIRWEIEPTGDGTRYRLTHDAVDGDADLAARWHALLLQLDMYLAAGQLVPVSHERWVSDYDAIL